jgi:hypothetical protein
MSRLSREKKREQERAAHSAGLVAAPIDVRVPADGSVGAWIGGVPVTAAVGEEIQQAVLNHLHRIVLATGHPVRVTVHDERIGYVLPLQVTMDGASSFTGEPVRMAPPSEPEKTSKPGEPRPTPAAPPAPLAPSTQSAPSEPAAAAASPAPAMPSGSPALAGPPPVPSAPSEPAASAESAVPAAPPAPSAMYGPPAPGAPVGPAGAPSTPAPVPGTDEPSAPAAGVEPSEHEQAGRRDKPTHVLRAAGETAPTFPLKAVAEPQPLGENVPTFPLRAVPESAAGSPEGSVPTFALRAVPEPAEDRVPGTVAAPTGEFGPPPPMDAVPQRRPEPEDAPAHSPVAPDLDLDPKPTPARGFDAVAEAVLGDETPATAPDFLAEPMAQINEAVKSGRIETAAGLAESTVGQASAALGPEHPEVLRLRELTAYIAYLAGDPIRSFRLSLDLARIRRRARDAEAAYGNVQSAASAWRAVRDPRQGLDLGRELIGLWTELTAEDGPAAEDIEQLESARARMGRLTERARKSAQPPIG